jgi:hypothetical protein
VIHQHDGVVRDGETARIGFGGSTSHSALEGHGIRDGHRLQRPIPLHRRAASVAAMSVASVIVLGGAPKALGQGQEQPATPDRAPSGTVVACASKPGTRQVCPADTSQGVILRRSSGESACLLGKTWGYSDKAVWVADGCDGEFLVAAGITEVETPEPSDAPRYVPNLGFRIVEDERGEMYVRLFTYARYLNQEGLDSSYTDAFGTTHTVVQREDAQLQKFFLPFAGWFLTPKFRYYLYVWSANTAQGEPAQVVGGGNVSYVFNRHATFGAGITSLPSVRSTEGQFPYWLGVDDRMMADEFFRGSYTTGFWLKGEFATTFKYMAMIGNNLSQLGVSASQLDNTFDTTSYMVQWLPTTGEFGLYGTFGDYDYHEKVATRLGLHYTQSTEDKQSQPASEGIENTQVRLSDGSVIFTPDLFAPGTTVEKVRYRMSSVDAGVKYKGLAAEAEFYWRWLSDYVGPNTSIIPEIDDHGYQLQLSAMAVPKLVQVYAAASSIFGAYGDASELRAGANIYPVRQRGIRVNGEWIHVNKSPVGYTAYPMPVGANGNVFHLNLELNF